MGGRKQHDLSATDFTVPLLLSLYDLSNGVAGEVVPFKHTHAPTCKRLGIDIDTYGAGPNGRPQTIVWIGWAFTKYIRDKGLGKSAGRGKWTLTDEGITIAQAALSGSGGNVDPATVLARVEDDSAAEPLVQTIGVSLVVGPTNEPEDEPNNYHDDPYIRSLAIAETKCYGSYSSRSPVCTSCGLASACRNRISAELSALALTLAAEDKAAVEAAAKPAEPDPIDPVKEPEEHKPPPAPTNSGTWDNSGAEVIIAHVAAKCYRCGEPIEGSSEVYWIKDKGDRKGGLFHKDCW